jgi:type II secretory pathway component PulL
MFTSWFLDFYFEATVHGFISPLFPQTCRNSNVKKKKKSFLAQGAPNTSSPCLPWLLQLISSAVLSLSGQKLQNFPEYSGI